MAEEEEVGIEVEAVEAVYGDDCVVLRRFPPHLHVLVKPRTGDVFSEQFVEAVLGIRASPQYPMEAPHIFVVKSKGLDEERQKHLLNSVHDKASELSSNLMLVALCEEAVERLSTMNHPDGNCPLCLYPFVQNDTEDNTKPFMKLISCYHCFHSECVVRWYHWLQADTVTNHKNSVSRTDHISREREDSEVSDMATMMRESNGNCPVCRTVFHAKDIKHVLDMFGSYSYESSSQGESEVADDEKLLESDSEVIRRDKFEAILRLQQDIGGLIEPKKNEVIRPGMYLPQPIIPPVATAAVPIERTEQQQRSQKAFPEMNSRGGSSNTASTSEHRRSHIRKHGVQNSRNQKKPVQHGAQNSRNPVLHGVQNSRNPVQHGVQNSRNPVQHGAQNSRNPVQHGVQNARNPVQHGMQKSPAVPQWVKKETGA